MGMYNSIGVPCPNCGTDIEFQSKSGSCTLRWYDIYEMPHADLEGIEGNMIECDCGHCVKISDTSEEPVLHDFSHLVS